MSKTSNRGPLISRSALFSPRTTMTGKVRIGLCLVTFSLLFPAGCKLTRAGYASGNYNVVRKDGAFEIRDYPTLTLVSTPINAATPTDDDSFMRLFRYISGANETESKIAMTTRVFTDQAGTNRLMSFVVPHKLAAADLPKAKRDDVTVMSRPVGRFAVHRFSGRTDAKGTGLARTKLIDWVQAQGLHSNRGIGNGKLRVDADSL